MAALDEEENVNKKSRASNVSKNIGKKLAKSLKNNVAKKSTLKLLMPILTWVIVGIVALIIIIGIVLFFITMPGMVMDKLKQLALKIGKDLSAFFGGDTTRQVDDQEIYDTLDYIESMGYDLKGYGFLTDYVGNTEDGVIRDDEDNIEEAKSDFIYTYLVSDNYVYTIANFNQTNGWANSSNLPTRIFGGFISVFQRRLNILSHGQLGRFWGRGMISIYYEAGVGTPGAYYGGLADALGWSDVKISLDDENKKTLNIRRGIGSDTVSYNLNGWTGRYGMPIDFLIAVHIATMMPDLAYDMVESFDPQIVILLHPEGSVFTGDATYNPYIAYVKNHWYRDIYFIQANKEFVDYDYEYESVMKERWTLYKTNEDGEYLLYLIDKKGDYVTDLANAEIGNTDRNKLVTDSDGYYYFEGSKEEAAKEELKVAKKAETLKYDDNEAFEEISWNKNWLGRWSAYEEKDGVLKQTGEGLRTETNPTIKKIFLQNTYFRYDGSKETAEIITKLRKKVSSNLGRDDDNLYYGVLKGLDSDENEVNYTNVSYTEDGKTYKVSDYAGEVSLNQDSLNAFSMLENEHTLDADYIYRDFKELIVELGYFEKEELTDETPRLLEFLVPDIGSFGYPKRTIDKNENEYGTMIHSKGDIKVINVLLQELVESEEEEINDPPPAEFLIELEQGSEVSSIQAQNNVSTKSVGTGLANNSSIESISSNPEEWREKFMETCKEVAEKVHGYYYLGASDFPYSFPIGNLGHLSCSSYLSECLFQLGYEELEGRQRVYASNTPTSCVKQFINAGIEVDSILVDKALVTSELESYCSENDVKVVSFDDSTKKNLMCEGDICFNITSGNHTYIFAGENDESTFWKYAFPELRGASEQNDYKCTQSWNKLECAVRLVPGKINDDGEKYEGYNGNDAVVSPVTGILLEYGTYSDEKEGEDGEEYRVNTDLKYPQNYLMETENELPESVIQSDKVGYAKILVLDEENYKKLEASLKSSTRFKNEESFLKQNGKYRDIDNLNKESVKDWSDIDKTLYGYKEFAENYQKYGIDGYVVYIDGFKCELPDEEFDNEDKENLKTQNPSGEELQLSDFEKVTKSIFDGDGKVSNKDELLNSKYEKDDKYKIASKKASDKLNIESTLKDEALSSMYVEGIRFIKEGTVIGRTLTDRELITSIRNQSETEFQKSRITWFEHDDEKDEIIGNYIRIIFRDKNKTVVENVEDYMKLDDGDTKSLGNIEEFMYYQAMEPEGFWFNIEGEDSTKGLDTATRSYKIGRFANSSDKYGWNYYVDDGGAGDDNLRPGIYLGSPSDRRYSGYIFFNQITGKTDVVKWQTYVTAEQLLDIYTLELDHVDQLLRGCIGENVYETLNDYQKFGLWDCMYSGIGYFTTYGTLCENLRAGKELTLEDFVSNVKPGADYSKKRRRVYAYHIYKDGLFGYRMRRKESESKLEDFDSYYQFTSDTPFQDLMRDQNSAYVVDM